MGDSLWKCGPKLLPQHLVDRLHEAQVDPWQKAKDVETMVATNAATGETLKPVPSPGGKRVSRKALRRLVGEGIGVQVQLLKDFLERANELLVRP